MFLWATIREYPARCRGGERRQRLAAVLALLWGFYTLLGASGAALCAANAPRMMPANPAASARACSPAPVMHCAMCRSMNGGRARCCCGAKGVTPGQRAVLSARCDHGAPAVLAAVTFWPVTVPDQAASAHIPRGGTPFLRAAGQSAPSRLNIPPTPPPCLL